MKDKGGTRMKCSSCEMVSIQGMACHEHGCPDAWRDEIRKCKWCGQKFTPEERNQRFCEDSCREALEDAQLIVSAVNAYGAHRALVEAATHALPLLVQLGNYIGNGDVDPKNPDSLGERCDVIAAIRNALAAIEEADYQITVLDSASQIYDLAKKDGGNREANHYH